MGGALHSPQPLCLSRSLESQLRGLTDSPLIRFVLEKYCFLRFKLGARGLNLLSHGIYNEETFG